MGSHAVIQFLETDADSSASYPQGALGESKVSDPGGVVTKGEDDRKRISIAKSYHL